MNSEEKGAEHQALGHTVVDRARGGGTASVGQKLPGQSIRPGESKSCISESKVVRQAGEGNSMGNSVKGCREVCSPYLVYYWLYY